MKFNSLEEIREHFELDSMDFKSVKKVLKKRIKKVHPDENNGDFKSFEKEKKYHEIHSALEFLKNAATDSLSVPQTDLSKITDAINKLVKLQTEDTTQKQIKKKDTNLDNIIDSSVETFTRKTSGLKITGIAITIALTALWSFPSVVKEHPILSILYEYHNQFTIIWILTLIITAIIWIKIKSIENLDKQIKSSYKVESIQNQMFTLFIYWFRTEYRNTDFRDEKMYVKFSKDDLANFLINDYDYLEKRLSKDLDGRQRMNEVEEIKKKRKEERGRKNPLLLLAMISMFDTFDFFEKPGEIDLETAQTISDLIMERLKSRSLIVLSKDKSLSDKFEYEFRY